MKVISLVQRFITFALLGIVILFFTPGLALAQENIRTGESIIVPKDQIINKDFFASGSRVTVSGTINGDTYLAGGEIVVDGVINGDLLIAGGNVIVSGTVMKNLRIVGGNVQVLGSVNENTSIVGGNIAIEKGSQINGNLVAAGGNVNIRAPIGKDITTATSQLTVVDMVGGDIVAAANNIEMQPGARVNGGLTYYSHNQASVDPNAIVTGPITQHIPPQNNQKTPALFKTAALGWILFNFLSALILGLLAIFLAPNIVRQKSEIIFNRPWISLGIGLATLILTPVIIFILFITIIGIPLALILLLIYLLLIFFVKIFVSIAIGLKLLSSYNSRNINMYWAFIVGLIIYMIVTSIPLIGGLISFIAVTMGIGAYLLTDSNFYKNLRSKKLI